MNNPFEAPQADLGAPPPASRREQVVMISGLIISALSALSITFIVPQFAKVFEGFGADLPLMSRLFANFYLMAWLMPVSVLAIKFLWPNPRQRTLLMNVCGIVLPIAMMPMTVVAMYLPMFVMASQQ